MSGEIEPEWTMIKASIVEAANKSCGQKVTSAFRTWWLTSEVKEAIKLNKGQLITQSGGVVGQWREHFEELLNQVNTFSSCGRLIHVTGSGHWLNQKASEWQGASAGWDSPWNAEDFEYCGTVLTDMPLQYCVEVWDSACGISDWSGHSHFLKRGVTGVLQL